MRASLCVIVMCSHGPCLQAHGVEKIFSIGPISPEEEKLLEACLPELKKNIEKGKAFVAQS